MNGKIDNLEKNSSDYSASLHKLSAMRRSVVQFKAWLNNASLYNSLDLIRCIFEAWYRQKEHWYNQQLCVDGETVIDIQPWRLICLPHEDLRIRLDPKLELGKNWRQLIFNRFEHPADSGFLEQITFLYCCAPAEDSIAI